MSNQATEINRLANYLLCTLPDEIGADDRRAGESAVDVAIRIIGHATNDMCLYATPTREACETFVGLPGRLAEDGSTVDTYGRPNGWCWPCWNRYRHRSEAKRTRHLVLKFVLDWAVQGKETDTKSKPDEYGPRLAVSLTWDQIILVCRAMLDKEN